jgi:two-component SAPR family response regulator
MDALWPDLDGDAVRNAFDLAVHRLRKLLKHKDAVQLSQGRLSLNPRLVWVDAFVLQRLSTEGFAEAHLSASVPALLTLYRGPLLADDDGPAIVAARQRLRSHFIRSVAALADRLEGAQQRRLVASLCRQAIDLEPLEEDLYRIWIRSLIARGHDAEAEAVYRRCEEMLAPLLRAKRSKSTRASLVAKRCH